MSITESEAERSRIKRAIVTATTLVAIVITRATVPSSIGHS